jgi:3-deoxy-manno-octulosonate cytidylyltransferase (CMP-KDO synthetase)
MLAHRAEPSRRGLGGWGAGGAEGPEVRRGAAIGSATETGQAMRFVVAVPARLDSARLPGKVMADIGGRPMLRRVLERCALARRPAATVLCTDSSDLVEAAESWGFPALLTSAECASGSERLAEALERLTAFADGEGATDLRETVILNVQGDQPFIDPAVIDAMAAEFERRSPTPEVLTPIYRLGAEALHNPNVVKTLVSADGRALYFSRSALPHVRGVDPADWHAHAPFWGHVGLYGYRADVLARWLELPPSPLEHIEKLEQLRLLEAGVGIGTFVVSGDFLSVDTAPQLEQARAMAARLDSTPPPGEGG